MHFADLQKYAGFGIIFKENSKLWINVMILYNVKIQKESQNKIVHIDRLMKCIRKI